MVLMIVLYSYGFLSPSHKRISAIRDKGSGVVQEKEEHANVKIVNDSNS
jgi:hypothetical protein